MSNPTQSVRLQTLVSPELASELERAAAEAELSLSSFLRMGLKEWLRSRTRDNSLQVHDKSTEAPVRAR
jgi:hypothetical protein